MVVLDLAANIPVIFWRSRQGTLVFHQPNRAGDLPIVRCRITTSSLEHYQFPRFGAGLGLVNRSNMFAAIDNTVVVPSHTRSSSL
jgi:hypothetical protein